MRELGRRLLTLLLWAGVVVALPLVGVRWLDSNVGMVAVLQSMVPLTGIAVTVLALVAAVTRRWRPAAAAGVLLTVCATIAVPSLLGSTVAPAPDDLVVMSANLEYGRADAQSLVVAARRHQVDVLVLSEITPAAVERLRVAGLDTLLPEWVGRSRQDAGGTIVRSRDPLTLADPSLGQGSPRPFDQPVVSIHRAGGEVTLRAVHSQPPSILEAEAWWTGLADLQVWRERQAPETPLVMAGDFNASWGHPGFRRVAETMADAHQGAGQGWVRTWPLGRRVIPAFTQLDHVLTRGLEVVDAGVVHLPNTDHAAVWGRLAPRKPQA